MDAASSGVGFTTLSGFNATLVRLRYEASKPYIREPVLEVGPADGGMTDLLADDFGVIIGTEDVEYTARNEELSSHFRTILCQHVLEHAEDPQAVLESCRELLKPGGHLLVSVPNAYSLHRSVGVRRRLISTHDDLGPRDKEAGHLRVYDASKLLGELHQARFGYAVRLPVIVKPFPDALMESLSIDMIDQLQDLAKIRPDLDSQLLYRCQSDSLERS